MQKRQRLFCFTHCLQSVARLSYVQSSWWRQSPSRQVLFSCSIDCLAVKGNSAQGRNWDFTVFCLGGQEKERDWILGLNIASQALSENDITDSPLLRVLGTWLMDARTVASTPAWTPNWAFSPNDSGRCHHYAHIITLSAEAWPEAIWAKTGRWHQRLICISEKHFIGIAR